MDEEFQNDESLDEELEEQQPQPEPYRPRPVWQVWGARLGLVVMIIAVILYYLQIAKGGL